MKVDLNRLRDNVPRLPAIDVIASDPAAGPVRLWSCQPADPADNDRTFLSFALVGQWQQDRYVFHWTIDRVDRVTGAFTGPSSRSSEFYRDPQTAGKAAFDALIRICRQTNENGNPIV